MYDIEALAEARDYMFKTIPYKLSRLTYVTNLCKYYPYSSKMPKMPKIFGEKIARKVSENQVLYH